MSPFIAHSIRRIDEALARSIRNGRPAVVVDADNETMAAEVQSSLRDIGLSALRNGRLLEVSRLGF